MSYLLHAARKNPGKRVFLPGYVVTHSMVPAQGMGAGPYQASGP